MSAGVIGLLIGLLAGVGSWRTLNVLGTHVDKAESRTLLNIVGLIELGLLPVLGYVIGVKIFG